MEGEHDCNEDKHRIAPHLETFLVRASEEDPLGDGLPGRVEEAFHTSINSSTAPCRSP